MGEENKIKPKQSPSITLPGQHLCHRLLLMQLQADLVDLKLLKDICSSAVLHSKSCQLHFDAELFTLSNAIPNAGIHYTCQIPHDRIFSESSLVAGDPKSFINVEINVESLLKTLKTISSNNSVRLKLKHRSPPHQGSYFIITSMQCLDNETFYPVSHEIAVIETPHVDYPSMDFSDPGVVLLELQDIMPGLLRTSERYRALDTYIYIQGKPTGFIFQIESRSLLGNVRSTWKGLTPLKVMDSNPSDSLEASQQHEDEFQSVRVRSRDWYNVLQMSAWMSKFVVCISDHNGVSVYGFLSPAMSDKEGTFHVQLGHISE